MVTVVDDAFKAGQYFIKNFAKSVQELKRDIKEVEKITCKNTNQEVNLEIIRNLNSSTNHIEMRESLLQLCTKNVISTTFNKNIQHSLKNSTWWEHEALQFMRGMMDECTHLKNFSVPFDTSLIIAICAKEDAYVPREGICALEDIWPGAEIRYLDAGHVSAYVLHQKLFRSSIAEAFARAKLVYEQQEYQQNV